MSLEPVLVFHLLMVSVLSLDLRFVQELVVPVVFIFTGPYSGFNSVV